MSRGVVALPFLLLATSCALFDRGESAPGPLRILAPAAPSAADELLAYLGSVRAQSATALTNDARRLRRAAGEDASGDLARLKAAVALTLAAHADETEILGLVEPVMKRDDGDAQLRTMASFLHAMALDRRRLRESATAATARLRDERRTQEVLRNRADVAQERAAQLQQKLDALTELEKSLSDRPTTR